MTAPARVAAFHALRSVSARRSDLPAALALTRQRLEDPRDRALAAEIVTGTLRWQRSVDHLAAHFAGRPLARLDADILTILRLSLYQILHLSRVPVSAVVDDAVDLARMAQKSSASGFVNAVLRTTVRQRGRLPLPPRPDSGTQRDAALAYLGITHSHPDWLVTRWLDRYGFEAAEAWVRFNNEPPNLTLRANRLRVTRQELQVALGDAEVVTEATRHAPDGLEVTSGNPLQADSDGSFFVQDEASQLVPLAVAARSGERVLDLCASPCGKTTAMAADMRDEGYLLATDVRAKRMTLLEQTVALSGARCIDIQRIPATGPLAFDRPFDRVLVDAPCSGLGTVRRDPDIRWRREESDLASFARTQLDLLLRAADAVAGGGRLVYATCSSEPEENEGVVDAFLSARPEFSPIDLRAEPSALAAELLDGRGMLRTTPFAHRLEAFFAAALVRR
jgi:16S rRNA (cytosine967-C5)-methyltransferase